MFLHDGTNLLILRAVERMRIISTGKLEQNIHLELFLRIKASLIIIAINSWLHW